MNCNIILNNFRKSSELVITNTNTFRRNIRHQQFQITKQMHHHLLLTLGLIIVIIIIIIITIMARIQIRIMGITIRINMVVIHIIQIIIIIMEIINTIVINMRLQLINSTNKVDTKYEN